MLKYLIWDWNGTRRHKLRSAPVPCLPCVKGGGPLQRWRDWQANIRFSPLLLLSA